MNTLPYNITDLDNSSKKEIKNLISSIRKPSNYNAQPNALFLPNEKEVIDPITSEKLNDKKNRKSRNSHKNSHQNLSLKSENDTNAHIDTEEYISKRKECQSRKSNVSNDQNKTLLISEAEQINDEDKDRIKQDDSLSNDTTLITFSSKKAEEDSDDIVKVRNIDDDDDDAREEKNVDEIIETEEAGYESFESHDKSLASLEVNSVSSNENENEKEKKEDIQIKSKSNSGSNSSLETKSKSKSRSMSSLKSKSRSMSSLKSKSKSKKSKRTHIANGAKKVNNFRRKYFTRPIKGSFSTVFKYGVEAVSSFFNLHVEDVFGLEELGKEVLKEPTLKGIADYIKDGYAKNIIVLSGAGISTNAGIPDFRSPKTGLYSNLQKYNLPYPEAIFTLDYFKVNPEPFYHMARQFYPGYYKPTITHYFIKELQNRKLLLREYTQNIDGLERISGLSDEKIVEAHGSFKSAYCVGTKDKPGCKMVYDYKWLYAHLFPTKTKFVVPRCERCGGLVKPAISFFGEPVPDKVSECAKEDFPKCDLLIIVGTSLKVEPLSRLATEIAPNVPRLLINKTMVNGFGGDRTRRRSSGAYDLKHFDIFNDPETLDSSVNRDVAAIGNCDETCLKLAEYLGFKTKLLQTYEKEMKRLAQEVDASPDIKKYVEEEYHPSSSISDTVSISGPTLSSSGRTLTVDSNESSSITVPSQDSNMTAVDASQSKVMNSKIDLEECLETIKENKSNPIMTTTTTTTTKVGSITNIVSTTGRSIPSTTTSSNTTTIDTTNNKNWSDETNSDINTSHNDVDYKHQLRMSLPLQIHQDHLNVPGDKHNSMTNSSLLSGTTADDRHISLTSSLLIPDKHESISSSLIPYPPSESDNEKERNKEEEKSYQEDKGKQKMELNDKYSMINYYSDDGEENEIDLGNKRTDNNKEKEKEIKEKEEKEINEFDDTLNSITKENCRKRRDSNSTTYTTTDESFSSVSSDQILMPHLPEKILASTNSYHNSFNHWNSSSSTKPELNFEATMTNMTNSISDAFSSTQAAISTAIANSTAFRENFMNEIKRNRNSISAFLETKNIVNNNPFSAQTSSSNIEKTKDNDSKLNEDEANSNLNSNLNQSNSNIDTDTDIDTNTNTDTDTDTDTDTNNNTNTIINPNDNDNNGNDNINTITSHIAATHQFIKNVIKTMEDRIAEDINLAEWNANGENESSNSESESESESDNDYDSNIEEPLNLSTIPSNNKKTLLSLLEEEEMNEEKEKENQKENESSISNLLNLNQSTTLFPTLESKSSFEDGVLTPKSIVSPQTLPIPFKKVDTDSNKNMYLSPNNSVNLEDLEDENEDNNNKKIISKSDNSGPSSDSFSQSHIPESSCSSLCSSLSSESPISTHRISFSNSQIRQELSEKFIALKEKLPI